MYFIEMGGHDHKQAKPWNCFLFAGWMDILEGYWSFLLLLHWVRTAREDILVFLPGLGGQGEDGIQRFTI